MEFLLYEAGQAMPRRWLSFTSQVRLMILEAAVTTMMITDITTTTMMLMKVTITTMMLLKNTITTIITQKAIHAGMVADVIKTDNQIRQADRGSV
jgi:hypothetical protein